MIFINNAVGTAWRRKLRTRLTDVGQARAPYFEGTVKQRTRLGSSYPRSRGCSGRHVITTTRPLSPSYGLSARLCNSVQVPFITMAGIVRQPIDEKSLERFISQNVPEIKTPIDIKQVNTHTLVEQPLLVTSLIFHSSASGNQIPRTKSRAAMEQNL